METNRLKRVRGFVGYKQHEVAELLGISRQAYNLKENGKSLFSLEDILILSKYLSLTLDDVNAIFFNNMISK